MQKNNTFVFHKLIAKDMNTNLKIHKCNEKSKIFILFAFIMLLGCNLVAQEDSKTETKSCFTISSDKMNVLYTGIPNLVSVVATSVPPEKLHISWGGATATAVGGCRYEVFIPDSFAGRAIDFTLSAETKRGKIQKLGSITFRVKSLPEVSVFIGAYITGGRQSKEVLLENPLITARYSPDFNYHLRWEVLSYKVTFIINGDEEAPIMVSGARFSELVLNKIKDAPSGTIIEFSDIRIQSIAGMRDIQKMIVVRIQ